MLLSDVSGDAKVSLQAYNRGGVLYDAYDEMLVEIIPPLKDKTIEHKIRHYFVEREKKYDGSTELYLFAYNILGIEPDEQVYVKYMECKTNAVSLSSLKSVLNRLSNWTTQRKIDFISSYAKNLGSKEEIEKCIEDLKK